MRLDAEISELSGHLRHIEVEVPANIQLIEVACEGLTDWTLSGRSTTTLDIRSSDQSAEKTSTYSGLDSRT